MWSLPDIGRLNSVAAERAPNFEHAVETGWLDGELISCHYCDKPADYRCLWFDIFSDDPKGVVGLCEQHDRYYGSLPEGYFECEACNRLFIENYTWELYFHQDGGGIYCLNCYAAAEVQNPDNWLSLDDATIDALTFQQVCKAKHLIAVRGPIPEGLALYKNVELDGSSGGRLTSSMSCESTPDGGVQELRDILHELKSQGVTEAMLILDAAYQFSVSIGVYTREAVAEAA